MNLSYVATLSAALLATAATGAFAASTYSGTWKVTDTSGTPFEIVLKDDGTAAADRSGEGMKGTWKEEAGGVTINWDTGWVTKIAKDGEGFKKTATEKGKSEPANSSAAEKVK